MVKPVQDRCLSAGLFRSLGKVRRTTFTSDKIIGMLFLLGLVMPFQRLLAAEEQPEYGRVETAEQKGEAVGDEREVMRQMEGEVGPANRQELREALQFYRSGKWPEAVAVLEGLLQSDPTVMPAWHLLGQTYWKAGRQDDALKLWNRLKLINPDFFPLYNWMGRAYMLRGEYGPAIEAFRTSLRLQPRQEADGAALTLARLLRWTGNLEEAAALLRPLHQAFPGRQDIARELASALISNRDFAEALPLWTDLQAEDPTNTVFMAKYAVALLHTGHAEEAIQQARHILNEDSGNVDVLRLMADYTQFHANQPEEALVWLRRLIDQTETFKTKRQLSLRYVFLYMKLNALDPERFNLSRPAAMLAQIVEADPYDVDVIMAYSEVLMGDHRYAQAREQLNRALKELNPNSIRAENNLFEIALAESNFNEAMEHFQRRAAFNPRDPFLHYLLARWYAAQERYRAAYHELDLLEAAGQQGAVAVLLYHGLSASDTGEVLPAMRLHEQLAALKQAGFRFIAAHELPAYFDKRAKLATTLGEASLERVVCVTFDDARRDTMRYGTPIGKELKIPFSMHIPVGYVLQGHPFICTWDMLRDYQKAGCWHFGGHTLFAHDRTPIDAEQRLGFALPNHIWIGKEKRLETDEEYAARLSREYDECRDLITRNLGHANECNFFAYPFGDIGQITRSNDREAPQKNLEHAAHSYAVGFIQTSFGYAVAGDNPLLFQRYEPDRSDSAEAVLTHILENHPVFQARRLRAEYAALENKRHLMLGTLRAMQVDGYPLASLQKLIANLEQKLGRRIPLPEVERAEPTAPVSATQPPESVPVVLPEKSALSAVSPADEKKETPAKSGRRSAVDEFDGGRPALRDLHNPLK